LYQTDCLQTLFENKNLKQENAIIKGGETHLRSRVEDRDIVSWYNTANIISKFLSWCSTNLTLR